MTTILVVDDEPDVEPLILQKFRKRIAAGEVAFRFAHDGVAALDAIGAHQDIDLVLADINMPRMDGLTLLTRLQESADPLATVMVSAYGDMTNIRTAMNRGAFDFVTKPIDFADLDATIAKTLRHIAAKREAQNQRLEAERAHAALARYFSPNLAAELAARQRTLDLSGARREVSALFTDVAGFTGLVETLEPARLSGLLNRYFGGMTDIVFEHGGTVAKVMGDALHVLFGAPALQEDHAARAVACALALDDFAERFRAEAGREDVAFGATRIGVNSGPALVGDFGGGRYFDYTAYGDAINIAARLEAANKTLGTRVCVSTHTAERIDNFLGRPVGDLVIRGRTAPLRAFEPLRPSDAAPKGYAAAFALLAAGDAAALPAFATLVGEAPRDTLSNLHLKRLLNGEKGALIA